MDVAGNLSGGLGKCVHCGGFGWTDPLKMFLVLVLRWGPVFFAAFRQVHAGIGNWVPLFTSVETQRDRGTEALSDLRPDNQTDGCHQGAAASSGSRRLHYSASQHVTVFVRAQHSSPRHFLCSLHSARAVLNINVLRFSAGVQFTVFGQKRK